MSGSLQLRLRRRLAQIVGAALAIGVSVTLPASPVSAQATPQATASSESARRVLRSMSDYLAAQRHLSARFEVGLEIITPEVQKIQFAASGDFLLSRPNNVRVSRLGGYSDVQMYFNGQRATIVDRDGRKYAHLEVPGTVDQLVDRLRDQYSLQMPGFDLLLANSYEELMRDVVLAHHIGTGIIDGVECEHLAFRNADVDWQIWIRAGDRPLPCRYVITSKTVAAAPQYTVQFRDWDTSPAIGRNAFAYTPPAGAAMVPFADLSNIGELPPPAPFSQGNE
ncbi:MAG: DUF2092 domain-containing protein [Allosphingosinicella sp.]